MNEFELQAWERELSAWRRRLERQAPPEIKPLLHAVAIEVGAARAGASDDERARLRLERGFAELRALYDRLAGSASVTTPA
jgi:thymidylate kinase